MKRITCKSCGRFLCELEYGELEITCSNSKCKTLNKIKVVTYESLMLTPTEKKHIIQA